MRDRHMAKKKKIKRYKSQKEGISAEEGARGEREKKKFSFLHFSLRSTEIKL